MDSGPFFKSLSQGEILNLKVIAKLKLGLVVETLTFVRLSNEFLIMLSVGLIQKGDWAGGRA